jgi:hypothetical protein
MALDDSVRALKQTSRRKARRSSFPGGEVDGRTIAQCSWLAKPMA